MKNLSYGNKYIYVYMYLVGVYFTSGYGPVSVAFEITKTQEEAREICRKSIEAGAYDAKYNCLSPGEIPILKGLTLI
jgi:hypothetical protein